jgi:hypothetical protein
MGLTTDRNDPGLRELRFDGQQKVYLVLSEEERAKGFVRPVRYSYIHVACGGETRMAQALCETYARDPHFYGGTFCCACGKHFRLRNPDGSWAFLWDPDGDPVGSDPEEAAAFFADLHRKEAEKTAGDGI